jgi:hypothetical protein
MCPSFTSFHTHTWRQRLQLDAVGRRAAADVDVMRRADGKARAAARDRV